MPRFVLLFHQLAHLDGASNPPNEIVSRGDHWDLMLESSGQLLTWSVPINPWDGFDGPVQRLPDHRLAYLDYEGNISGNRGRVTRIQSGEFNWVSQTSTELEIEFPSKRRAKLKLTIPNDSDPNCWHLNLQPSND